MHEQVLRASIAASETVAAEAKAEAQQQQQQLERMRLSRYFGCVRHSTAVPCPFRGSETVLLLDRRGGDTRSILTRILVVLVLLLPLHYQFNSSMQREEVDDKAVINIGGGGGT